MRFRTSIDNLNLNHDWLDTPAPAPVHTATAKRDVFNRVSVPSQDATQVSAMSTEGPEARSEWLRSIV